MNMRNPKGSPKQLMLQPLTKLQGHSFCITLIKNNGRQRMLSCPTCGSANTIKYGIISTGKQRYFVTIQEGGGWPLANKVSKVFQLSLNEKG